MLLSIIEIRNRMLNCLPDSVVSVTFVGDEDVQLTWEFMEVSVNGTWRHRNHIVTVPIHSISAGSRSFERTMHKAKRFLKHGGGKND